MHKASQVELEFESVGYEDRGKPEYPKKSLPDQRREPTTNSDHVLRRRRDLNPGHTRGRLVVSPLSHPCFSANNKKGKSIPRIHTSS